LFVTFGAFAQTPLSFEVASVKKAEPLSVNLVMSGKMNLGMVIDNAQVNIKSMSIAELMRVAYKVKPYQVSGPEWLTAERYTITAKMPAGTTRDQVPEMMQALLAERFKLAFHRETKEQSVYALTVMKSGLKLQESPSDDAAPAASGGPATPQGAAPTDGSAQVRVNVTSDAGGTVQQASPNGNGTTLPASFAAEMSRIRTMPPDRFRSLDPTLSGDEVPPTSGVAGNCRPRSVPSLETTATAS